MKYFILIFITVLFGVKLNAQIFDTYNENIVKMYAAQLLSRYDHLSDFTEDGISISKDYKKSFETMFVNNKDRNLYNDLKTKGGYISAMEYTQIVDERFPHGLETKIDSLNFKFLQTKLLNGNQYSIELIANKYVVGVTNENKIHRKKTTVHFIIQFKYFDEDEEFDNFLIASITNEETLLKQKSDKQMQGFHIGFNLLPGISQLSLAKVNEGYIKNTKLSLSSSLGLSIYYFINSNFGLSAGVNYSIYNTQSNSEYNNGQSNNLERIDRDGDNYFLYIDSKINEDGKFIFFDIPLNLTYRHGLANKTSFYATLGFITSFKQSADFSVTGNASQSGYYSDYHLLIDNADLYQFGAVQYNDTYAVTISDLQFMTSVSAGVSFPVRTAGLFNLGLGYRQNISKLEYNTPAYRDDFVSINGVPENSWLQFLYLSISYTHKIF